MKTNGALVHDPFEENATAALLPRLRLPPPVRIDRPAGKQATYEPGSLRARVAAWADEHGLDLTAPLTAEEAARIARAIDADPQAVRVALQHVRQGRGLSARRGNGGGRRREPSLNGLEIGPQDAGETRQDARALALAVIARLLESGEAEDVRRAASIVERLL